MTQRRATKKTAAVAAALACGIAWSAPLLGQTAAPGRAATAAPYSAPRTPWGHPDLQGTYSNDDETGTPMERPAQFEGKTLKDITPEELERINKQRNQQFVDSVSGEEFAGGLRPPAHLIFDTFDRRNKRPWLVVDPEDGKIPARTEAARSRPRPRGISTNANPNGPFDSWLDMGLYDRCITRGIPASMMPAGYGSRYEIVQSPDSVAIRYEMIHETRVIPLDGRPHLDADLTQYLGDARAHWEGDTLVVVTRNFRGDSAPQGSSESVTMTERFRPVAPSVVEWSVTFEDPATWTRPWTFMMPLTKVDASQQIFEYACHEGNNAMRNILSAARAAERGEQAK